ncbi:MAG: hypothetical protein V4850_03280 [Myxococcota bacterium]
MARFLLLLALPFFACTGGEPTDSGKRPNKDAADTDTDTDADSDTDTDTDTDTDADVPDLTTYDGFVEAHAGAYCNSVETCGYLDEQGYDTKALCIQGITEFYAVACPDYQQAAGELCVRGDLRMAGECETSNSGEQPLPCRDVCTPPEAR